MPSPAEDAEARARQQAVEHAYESLTPFETVLVHNMAELHKALLEEFQGMRRDIVRLVLAVGGAAFVLLLVLAFGLLATRGVDPQDVADATKTVSPAWRGDPPSVETDEPAGD